MVDRQREMQCEILEHRVAGLVAFLIAVLFRQERWHHQRAELAVPWPARGNFHCPADRRYHDLHVVRIGVIVHPDRRLRPRIGAVDDDFTAAVRQYRVGEQQQVFRVVRHAFGRVVEKSRCIDVDDRPQEIFAASGQEANDLGVVPVQVADAARAEDHGIGQ